MAEEDFDYDSAVVLLADDAFPYGNDCPINRKIQAVLAHYGICAEDVSILVWEDLHLKREFKLVNPDGNEEQKQAYQDALGSITKAVRRSRMLAAVRRVLSKDPYSAVTKSFELTVSPSSDPPSKKRKTGAVNSSSSSAADDVSPGTSAAASKGKKANEKASSKLAADDVTAGTSAAASKGKKAKEKTSSKTDSDDGLIDISSDESLSGISDSEDDGESAGNLKDDKDDVDDDDRKRVSRRTDINSLFNDAASQVNSLSLADSTLVFSALA